MLINTSAVFPCRDMEVVVYRMPTPVVPKASPDILPELATYLAPFASLFRRSTSRASVERYLTGLLTDLPRKNCDTIAAAVAGTSTERLQHLLTDATWDPQALDQQLLDDRVFERAVIFRHRLFVAIGPAQPFVTGLRASLAALARPHGRLDNVSLISTILT